MKLPILLLMKQPTLFFGNFFYDFRQKMEKNNIKVFFLSLKNDRRIPWSRRFVVVVVGGGGGSGDEIDFAWQENVPGPDLMNTSQ